MVIEIKSIEQFDQVIQEGITLIKFGAPWCGPCRMLAPILEEVSKQTEANICEVNSDDLPELMERFGIRSVPTLFFFKDGEKIDALIGSQTKENIIEKLNSLL